MKCATRWLLLTLLAGNLAAAGCCNNRPLFGGSPYSNSYGPQYYAQPVQQPMMQQPMMQQPVQCMQPQMVCPQPCPQVCTPCY